MGRACSTHGIDEKCIQYFGWNMKGRGHAEGLSIDGKITLKQIFEK
jgi:hypothetical protein